MIRRLIGHLGVRRRADAIVVTLDEDGNVVAVSKSFEKLFGYAPHGGLHLSIADIVHPEDIAAARELLRVVFVDGDEVEVVVRVRDAGGAWHRLAGNVQPFAGPGDVRLGRAVTSRLAAADA
jgi:PAS domain S-box-containing protein